MNEFPIDLSMLTEAEQDQFRDEPETLYDGDKDVCLYMRFSSERQSEQSIEGQLRECRAFCLAEGYRITGIYVDRATTARKNIEKRTHFMEMIADSAKREWQYVVVWKLDRFARNRTDSAIARAKLRKNDVKVLSATERITDAPEGIILEAVLEGMAEFYSADLAQKINRGMHESALKCHSLGGRVPLGYKIENKKLVIDPVSAPIVREAFELYAAGTSVADICRIFNGKGYRTAVGGEFNRSSFKNIWRNEKYIGVYKFDDVEIEGGVPAIVDKDLFETVNRRLKDMSNAPGRGKAKVEYMLSGKLYCGRCGSHMNGSCGTGRNKKYYYYLCHKHKTGDCKMPPIPKDWIEQTVTADAMSLLTDEMIDKLADMAVYQCQKDIEENTIIPKLEADIADTEKRIDNLTKALETGLISETVSKRLSTLERQKKSLTRQLANEVKMQVILDKPQVVFWLSRFKDGDISDPAFQRQLINLLIRSVTVLDEPDCISITTAYNLTDIKTRTQSKPKEPTEVFGFGENGGAIGSTSEPLMVIDMTAIMTKKHPRP